MNIIRSIRSRNKESLRKRLEEAQVFDKHTKCDYLDINIKFLPLTFQKVILHQHLNANKTYIAGTDLFVLDKRGGEFPSRKTIL
ncbi:MAG: hypothetical protein HNEKOMLI_00360 [Sodalis sp. Psp]|nr:hypothetical protein [Sodalis sp. Psp]MCR3756846.1 hypothetical protein [Sodalis sp. Ppy]